MNIVYYEELIKKIYPNRTYRQYEYLNELFGKILKSLHSSPTFHTLTVKNIIE